MDLSTVLATGRKTIISRRLRCALAHELLTPATMSVAARLPLG
jgi:hypothetical protein